MFIWNVSSLSLEKQNLAIVGNEDDDYTFMKYCC